MVYLQLLNNKEINGGFIVIVKEPLWILVLWELVKLLLVMRYMRFLGLLLKDNMSNSTKRTYHLLQRLDFLSMLISVL